jgi:hypothetical protein
MSKSRVFSHIDGAGCGRDRDDIAAERARRLLRDQRVDGVSVGLGPVKKRWVSGGAKAAGPLRGPAAGAHAGLAQEGGDPQQIVGQHCRAHEHLEPLAPFQQAAAHTATA